MIRSSLLAALCSTLLCWVSCSRGVPVQFMVVKKGEALETILANGRIGGSRIVPLSFQKAGLVLRAPVSESSRVGGLDTLLILDNREEKNRVAQAKTAVDIARINLDHSVSSDLKNAQEALNQAAAQEELAQRQLERLTILLEQKAVAAVEIEKAQQAYDIAASQKRTAQSRLDDLKDSGRRLLEAQLAQAKNALDAAEIDLSKTFLLAPEEGAFVQCSVKPGASVTPGVPVCSFLPADTTTHVEVMVDEALISRIRKGQPARVGLSASPGKTFDATVRDIEPIVDASTGTVTVQLAIAQTATGLLPDQTVSAQIITNTIPGAVSVPQRYLQFDKDGTSVWLARGGKAVRQSVRSTALGNGNHLILEGVAEGDTLLFAKQLKPNEKIRPVP